MLGFLAALYHLRSTTAFFKGLLFLGAGSIALPAAHQGSESRWAGWRRRMPWTGAGFPDRSAGCLGHPAVQRFCQRMVYLPVFLHRQQRSRIFAVRVIAPLSAVLLALAGALAAMCFIKAYGGAFTGPARSQHASQAQEAPGRWSPVCTFLVLGCLALGLGAPLVAPVSEPVAASLPECYAP